MSQDQDHKRAVQTQTEGEVATAGHRVGLEMQASQIQDRKQNPQFYDKFVQSSISDSEKWSHMMNEFAVWAADDHVLANRKHNFAQQRELLNRARKEQSIVGANPGPRLREKPLANAIMQGVNPTLDEPLALDAAGQSSVVIRDPEFTPPMDSEERTVMDDLADAMTARQSRGVDQAGSEALTTATTENRTVREEESEQSGIASRVSGVFD